MPERSASVPSGDSVTPIEGQKLEAGDASGVVVDAAQRAKEAMMHLLLATEDFWRDRPLAPGTAGRIIAASSGEYVAVVGWDGAADALRELVAKRGCFVEDASKAIARLASTTRDSGALPKPETPVLELRESDRQSSECVCSETSTRNCPVHGQGLGSASALEVEAGELLGRLRNRAAMVLGAYPYLANDWRFGTLISDLASATKPEASPSPESEDLGDEQSSSSAEVCGWCGQPISNHDWTKPDDPDGPFPICKPPVGAILQRCNALNLRENCYCDLRPGHTGRHESVHGGEWS